MRSLKVDPHSGAPGLVVWVGVGSWVGLERYLHLVLSQIFIVQAFEPFAEFGLHFGRAFGQ